MPRVTVLLTCYNHRAYLPACAASVRAQTCQDFEVVAVDDASSDGSADWLREHAPDWTLVALGENRGTYAALNAGLARAGGEFVAILNDDDLWAPEKLERQMATFDADPLLGLVHTGGWFIDGSGSEVAENPFGFEFPAVAEPDEGLALLRANRVIASAAMARRSALGAFDETLFGSGDWAMWLHIAESWRVGFLAEPLTLYRVHPGNASRSRERVWLDDERIRQRIEGRHAEWAARTPDAAALQAAYAHNAACLGTALTLNGKPAAGRRAYALSLRRDPRRWKSVVRWLATFLPKSVFRRMA